jgi:hypothetical protein
MMSALCEEKNGAKAPFFETKYQYLRILKKELKDEKYSMFGSDCFYAGSLRGASRREVGGKKCMYGLPCRG